MGNMPEEKEEEKSQVVKAVEEAKYVILEKPKKNLDLFAVQPLMDLTGKVRCALVFEILQGLGSFMRVGWCLI